MARIVKVAIEIYGVVKMTKIYDVLLFLPSPSSFATEKDCSFYIQKQRCLSAISQQGPSKTEHRLGISYE